MAESILSAALSVLSGPESVLDAAESVPNAAPGLANGALGDPPPVGRDGNPAALEAGSGGISIPPYAAIADTLTDIVHRNAARPCRIPAMRRWVGNFLAGISLLLCLACAGVWVRSHFASGRVVRISVEVFGLKRPPTECLMSMHAIGLSHGGLFAVGQTTTVPPGQPIGITWRYAAGESEYDEVTVHYSGEFVNYSALGFAAFYLSNPLDTPRSRSYQFRLPLWFPTTLFALPPAIWLYRRRRKYAPGQCPACGYDLRATPGRCPECGAGAVA